MELRIEALRLGRQAIQSYKNEIKQVKHDSTYKEGCLIRSVPIRGKVWRKRFLGRKNNAMKGGSGHLNCLGFTFTKL